ncbi:hypothetical protein GO986_08715 [Deinococcus sp. HMF7620]|uniref:Uncharacterized protein n=1 Tax=Deinococcus arboris TaxID=2682977 RepID=A0A7C9MQX8_9DEIO|nr:hypothetical protein [Deinococcus arboris]MVN86844.1 hypothetical protein [Deinococcus arboris]
MSAVVIKFQPPTEPPAPVNKPKAGGYTNLDNDTDLALLAELPNALVKPALFLMSRRGLRQSAVHWGEVAAFCKRGQTQTSEALAALAALGYAVSEDGLWRWDYRVSTGNPPETRRKPGMSAPKKNVLHKQKQAPELRNEGTKEEEDAGAREALTLTAFTPTPEHSEREAGQAPDGAASDEAPMASPSQDQLDNAHCDGGNVDAEGLKQVPPAAPTYRAAMDAISGAGLLPVWQKWVRLNALKRVTQEAQAELWYGWIQDGQGQALGEQAAYIIEAGHYEFPLPALKKRMRDAATALVPVPVQARPALAVGQRVRYPDGSEATVLAVLSRGIATDHPDFPDVPLGQVKTLDVLS